MAKLLDTFREFQHKIHLPSGKSKTSDKHLKQLKEFFDVKQCCKFGFPSDATAFDFDPYLKLLAVATKQGDILIYGAPGVEFFAKHAEALEVSRLVFLPEEARLLSLTSDNKLHKWELNGGEDAHWHLDHVGELELGAADDDSQRVTAVGLVGANAWIGFENGKIKVLDVKEWKFAELELTTDKLQKDLSEEAQSQVKGWGAVVAITASPATGKKVAVGFQSGPIALLTPEGALDSVVPCGAELTSFAWQRDGAIIVSGHADGSCVHWKAAAPENMLVKQKENPNTVYGPFSCNPVTKLAYKTAKMGAFTVFAGGMSKNEHGERHTVTVMREQDHHCLDLQSPVVDFLLLGVVEPDPDAAQYDDPHTLLILCKEELLAVDLYGANWPLHRLPYLQSLARGSPVSLAKFYRQVSEDVVKALTAVKQEEKFSAREWPITGGKLLTEEKAEEDGAAAAPEVFDVLITAHENGTANFWRYLKHSFSHLATLNTGGIFELEAGGVGSPEGYPPFRAAGNLAGRVACEDPRVAVKTLDLFDDVLVIGGAAGQVSVWSATCDRAEVELDVLKVNADIVSTKDNYEWEGCAQLKVREGSIGFEAPFKATSLIQVFPPAPVASTAFSKAWGLLAVGTTHGLAVVDATLNRCVSVHSTIPAHEDAAAGDVTPAKESRGSQITMSLRQSFRKLKKLRPTKKEYTVNEASDADKENEKKEKKKDKKEKKKDKIDEEEPEKAADEETKEEEAKTEEEKPKEEEKKVEEAPAEEKKEEEAPAAAEVEEKKQDEAAAAEGKEEVEEVKEEPPQPQKLTAEPSPGLIQTLLFSNTFLVNAAAPVSCLFAGAGNGKVFAFSLTVPAAEKRQEELKAALSKELHLRHGAPVLRLVVFGTGKDLPVVGDAAVEGQQHHELLVVSEEQVKIFHLPSLKPKSKLRLAHGGSHKVKACSYGFFHSAVKTTVQPSLVISDSCGETTAVSVPGLRKLAVHRTLGQQEGLSLPRDGTDSPLGLHLSGSGQVDCFCIASTSCCLLPKAGVELAEGMRPKPEPVEQPAPKEEEKKEDEEEKKEEEEVESPAKHGEDLDKSNSGPVPADITMDDIKEYVTSSPAKTTEPIQEELKTPVQETPAAETPVATAEVKADDSSAAPASDAPEVTAE